MTEKTARSILTKFGYILDGRRGHYDLIDRRSGGYLSWGHKMSLDDVEQWIDDNLNLSNLNE